MCDKLVFDLSQEVEGSPNVFIRKDWINILDNQNQSYQNNQSIIDTSQLSNSNKYMSYREAYLAVPLILTAVSCVQVAGDVGAVNLTPNTTAQNAQTGVQTSTGRGDYTIGLKNWFGQIIHSFTLDYNGTTIVQQTPFCNMWNTFKLLTTLSYSDIITQGSTIGFYPDTSSSWTFTQQPALNTAQNVAAGIVGNTYGSLSGEKFVCNNTLSTTDVSSSNLLSSQGSSFNPGEALGGNYGLTKRIQWINFNPFVIPLDGTTTYGGNGTAPNGVVIGNSSSPVGVLPTSMNTIWKSYISRQTNTVGGAGTSANMQISVLATIYLKHIHSFFNMIPLLKGVFMKMTMNLNNASTTITYANPGSAVAPLNDTTLSTFTVAVPVGGVNPLLIPAIGPGQGGSYAITGAGGGPIGGDYLYNISVGAIPLNAAITNIVGPNATGALSKSIYLYVPAYTFNPVFEQAYLSNPIKQIKYTDIYQYQVQNISSGNQFNNLITNGISNIKSVLIIPFFSQNNANNQNGADFTLPCPEYQSPFDPAGCGCTAPLITLGNFNVQISGQNAIYNTQRYTFEEFNNQLYGQNAVNGGLTDGLTSGLIGYYDFQQTYCYYYVNVERMLPVEQSVPKSVQIIGTNYSTQTIDLWVFIEYGVEINIDLQTGARV